MPRWKWFVDQTGPSNRIWIAWDDEYIDVDILDVGDQFIHCRVLIRCLHEYVLVTVVYGANDIVVGWSLWQALSNLAGAVNEEPWLDMSEVCSSSGDIRIAMEEYQACIFDTGLITLPM
ncbi:UNVERIFIED_CONTAM: hypothetical protein Slati_3517600 [Sesamum latifolium]|uniref:Uncharacterized protein n=1 Tax=Sesamum latifolium TaxID=2727402 RepID=A0AAW2UJK7_9LAMI